jgi:hypothetical protein
MRKNENIAKLFMIYISRSDKRQKNFLKQIFDKHVRATSSTQKEHKNRWQLLNF